MRALIGKEIEGGECMNRRTIDQVIGPIYINTLSSFSLSAESRAWTAASLCPWLWPVHWGRVKLSNAGNWSNV